LFSFSDVTSLRFQLLSKPIRNLCIFPIREDNYGKNPAIGCYMYYFSFRNRKYCVDATSESGKLGRLINHSTKTPNLMTRLFPVGATPHLIFVAARDVAAGVEFMYDYGDRSREAREAHPWLTS
jgi:histone-lysine N-methyltransferase SETD8